MCNQEKKQRTNTKIKQRSLGAISLLGALEKSPILLSQYKKNTNLIISPIIFLSIYIDENNLCVR